MLPLRQGCPPLALNRPTAKPVRKAILCALLALAGCGVDYGDAALRRQAQARKHPGGVTVAVIKDPGSESYINGILLAEKLLNERPQQASCPAQQALPSVSVRVLLKPVEAGLDAARATIAEIAANPRVVAVLGHAEADVAIPASAVYEASRLVFMPPFATESGLTAHGFKFVFRMAPSALTMAGQMASAAEVFGYKNIVLLHAQEERNRELGLMLEDAAAEQGMGLVHKLSFSSKEMDYRDLIAQFSGKDFDMVFLAAGPAAGARMVRQMREMGIKAPVMGGDALGSKDFVREVGADGGSVIAPTFYQSEAATQANQTFRSQYHDTFKAWPDQAAAQGYDSLRLFACASGRAGAATPPAPVYQALRFMPYWDGVTGPYAFDGRGEVLGKKYFFQVLREGEWHFLPGVHMPYFLKQFDRQAQTGARRQASGQAFSERFSKKLQPGELRAQQLEFLHVALGFRRLGVIYAETQPETTPERLAQAAALAKERGFEVVPCSVGLAGADRQRAEENLIECYGKLAAEVDALTVAGMDGIGKDALARLQKPLAGYKIPLLVLPGDAVVNEAAAIRVGRLGDRENLQAATGLYSLGGALRDIKAQELAERLENLPVLEAGPRALDDAGLPRRGPMLGLALGL